MKTIRPRSQRQKDRDKQRGAEYKADGRCIDCGGENDRLGEIVKNGMEAVKCRACVERQKAGSMKSRSAAMESRGSMAAALGLTMEQANALALHRR